MTTASEGLPTQSADRVLGRADFFIGRKSFGSNSRPVLRTFRCIKPAILEILRVCPIHLRALEDTATKARSRDTLSVTARHCQQSTSTRPIHHAIYNQPIMVVIHGIAWC